MLMCVSEVCVSAGYDIPSMYFISFSLGTIANEKENYNFIRDKIATNIHTFSFCSITMRAFVN